MKQYKHLFFDLDHTLWDFEKNSRETLEEIHRDYLAVRHRGITVENFMRIYWKINNRFWAQYRKGVISKEELRDRRFYETLKRFQIDDRLLSSEIAEYYIAHSPLKSHVFPHAHETLDYLKSKYALHIITNGFEEVQFTKLDRSKLSQYFEHIITSEQVGEKKPHAKVFHYALKSVKARNGDCLMIGDNLEADILGAKEVGIDQVYFNPKREKHSEVVTFEINGLGELINLL